MQLLSDTSSTSNNSSKTLIAFNSLPESAQNELLKPSANESTATTEELELMKMLDSADNMLNSGYVHIHAIPIYSYLNVR